MKRFLSLALLAFVLALAALAVPEAVMVGDTAAEDVENTENVATLSQDIWDGTIATGFDSGTGTEADPYIIKIPEQLAFLASSVNSGTDYYGKYIKLANDIYLNDTTGWENWDTTAPANSWTPIGNDSNDFRGTFDGNGCEIGGIYINSTSDYQGLFGYFQLAIIKNFGVVDSYIKGNEYVGGIVGYGSPTNCYNTGTICGRQSVGGITGSNGFTVANCYNTGTVSGSSDVGGIVGDNSSGTVINCYNTGTVNGSNSVGGIVGSNIGTISNCYNIGTVYGSSSVGSIVGYNFKTVRACYYLIGCSTDGLGITQNGIGTYSQGSITVDVLGKTTALTDSQMKQNIYYDEFDFKNIWIIEPSFGYEYPQFMINLDKSYGEDSAIWDGIIATNFDSGSGTETDPYIIKTAEQLAFLFSSVNSGTDYSSKFIKLANDIIFNDNTKKNWILNATPWIPIGNSSNPFNGTFDGQGYEIIGIYINTTDDYQGLFGYVKYGTIKNVGIIDSYLKGGKYTSGVVGYSYKGKITNCYNTSNVCGSECVGGVIGGSSQDGTVKNCYNTGEVSGSDENVGGVVGRNLSTTTHCYNVGSVSGTDIVGGVVGNASKPITCCYNTGKVIGSKHVGGVVGYCRDLASSCYNTGNVIGNRSVGGIIGGFYGTVKDCFYLTGCATDGNGVVQYGIGNSTQGSTTADDSGCTTGLTDAQMKIKENFIGFDFDTVWAIINNVNNGYPHLKELPPANIAFEITARVIGIGDTFKLNVTITPDSLNTTPLIWTSSNTDIATIENGIVKGVSEGSATITVTTFDGQLTSSCQIIVGQVKQGDITCNDTIDISDAILLFQHSMMASLYPIDYPGALDFTKDGEVNINDAILLFQHSMMPGLYPLE